MMNYLKMLILLKLMNLLTDCNAKINEIESKTPSITSLATNAALNAKTNEVKGEIPSISDIATTAVLTTVENKISNYLVIYSKKKNRLWYQILEIEGKYFITSDCNKFMSEIIDTKIKQKELVNKFDI